MLTLRTVRTRAQLTRRAVRLISSTPASARETGQPCLGLLGVLREVLLVDPGHPTLGLEVDALDRRPGVGRAEVHLRHRPHRVGGVTVLGHDVASAIEKQAACAAAISSSGLVPSPSSKRDENE